MDLLKKLYTNINETDRIKLLDSHTVLECLLLVIQTGPNHKLKGNVLRREFKFITKITSTVSKNERRVHNEIITRIITEFCLKVRIKKNIFLFNFFLSPFNFRQQRTRGWHAANLVKKYFQLF